VNDVVISERVIAQRTRNRILEYLEMVCGYPSGAPPWDLSETLNQWEDWVAVPTTSDQFGAPTFTAQEATALCRVSTAWKLLCDATPSQLSEDSPWLRSPEWEGFVAASESALAALSTRGRLSEEVEEDQS
jgi:hypothetical protein